MKHTHIIVLCIFIVCILWVGFVIQEQTTNDLITTDETHSIDLSEKVSKADSIYVENADIGHFDGAYDTHEHEEYWDEPHEKNAPLEDHHDHSYEDHDH